MIRRLKIILDGGDKVENLNPVSTGPFSIGDTIHVVENPEASYMVTDKHIESYNEGDEKVIEVTFVIEKEN